jgi:sugar phosphate permease
LVGALLIGVMNDKLNVKRTSIIVFFLFSAICLCIFAFGANVSILYVLVVILGFCTSSGGSQPAMLTSKLFGQKDYPGIFSKLSIAMSVSSLIAMPFYGFMFDLTGSYLSCLTVLAGVGVVMAILVFAGFSSAKKLWRDHAGMEMPAK